MEKEKTDLPAYRFRNIILVLEWLTPLQLTNPLMRERRENEKNSIPSLKELGIIVGLDFENEFNTAALEEHQRRFKLYQQRNNWLTWILYLLIGAPALMVILRALIFAGLPAIGKGSIFSDVIFYIFLFTSAYIAINAANRLASAWIDRDYAGTLAFVTCLYLLTHLTKTNLLAFTKDRQQLLIRMRGLKKYLALLPYEFAVLDSPAESWARLRFKYMAAFVDAKENQIIAPLANTQTEMIAEIQPLLNILLTGRYGEFTFESPAAASAAVSTTDAPVSIWNRILKFLGSVTPLFLLIAMFLYPDQFKILGLDNNTIGLISLAWLLLAIDANLKLGIVDRLGMLAKTFKDLK